MARNITREENNFPLIETVESFQSQVRILGVNENFTRQLNPATRNTTGLPRPSLISYDVGD